MLQNQLILWPLIAVLDSFTFVFIFISVNERIFFFIFIFYFLTSSFVFSLVWLINDEFDLQYAILKIWHDRGRQFCRPSSKISSSTNSRRTYGDNTSMQIPLDILRNEPHICAITRAKEMVEVRSNSTGWSDHMWWETVTTEVFIQKQ